MYRAAVLLVAMQMMKPTIPTQMGPIMCQNFSWVLSACQALIIETMTENTQGGADMSRVGT
jgi:hypothetical protein